MSAIINTEIVANELGRWEPSDLVFIDEILMTRDPEKEFCNVTIKSRFQRRDICKTWPSENAPFFCIILEFQNVKEINLKGFCCIPMQITGFDIIDISDRQWERTNFLIEDYENGQIEFYCESVSILSAKIL